MDEKFTIGQEVYVSDGCDWAVRTYQGPSPKSNPDFKLLLIRYDWTNKAGKQHMFSHVPEQNVHLEKPKE